MLIHGLRTICRFATDFPIFLSLDEQPELLSERLMVINYKYPRQWNTFPPGDTKVTPTLEDREYMRLRIAPYVRFYLGFCAVDADSCAPERIELCIDQS